MQLVLCTLLLGLVSAQVVFKEGKLRAETTALDLADIPVVQLPQQNNALLLSKVAVADTLSEKSVAKGPYKFGQAVKLTAPITLASGKSFDNVWKVRIMSAGAVSLNLVFSMFHIVAEDAELYIVSESDVLGPFTSLNNKEDGQFATQPLAGEWAVIEYYHSNGSEDLPLIQIDTVVHGFRPMGRSGACNIDSKCDSTWQAQSRSVAMIMTDGGQGYCSGAMVNNAKNDGKQLFLTANHCAGRDLSSDMVMFNYEADACGSRSRPSNKHSAHGLKQLSRWASSDFALFEVVEKIPKSYGVFLAGWSAENVSPVNPVGIHHPSADMKKISFCFTNATGACWGSSTCGRRPEDHWKIQPWGKGTTEPGSSGSPLFDGKSMRIVGQLHGGSASCYNSAGYDLYGKVAASWYGGSVSGERLKDFLDPESTGTVAMDGRLLHDEALFLQN